MDMNWKETKYGFGFFEVPINSYGVISNIRNICNTQS